MNRQGERRHTGRRAGLLGLVAGALLLPTASPGADFTSSRSVDIVAFGSCNAPELAQPIWDPVADADPDIWIWAGDAIYADTKDVARFHHLYGMQNENEKYRAIREDSIVLGTWDDHDYGADNAGKEYPLKQASQQAFLDFLGEPADSLRRKRKGVYASYLFGKPGQRLKILLLDVRHDRDPPGPKADMLGRAQWAWLETELRRNDADLTLLISGTTILATEHYGEQWAHYPVAKARLMSLIEMSGMPVVLLSGNLHFAELLKANTSRSPWPLMELTSSGMTHSARGAHYKSSMRVGDIYYGLNFGLVDVDWGERAVSVTLQIRDTDGVARISKVVRYLKRTETD